MKVRELQQAVKHSRKLHNYSNGAYDLFIKMREETQELLDEMGDSSDYTHTDNMPSEVADVLILSIAICNKYNWNMGKLIKNKMRSWNANEESV